MQAVGRGLSLGLVGLVLFGTVPARPQQPAADKVELQAVKYDGLAQEVQKHKGKVVVVDVWGITCPPCMKEFPHLVELHNKYGGQGLVAISLHAFPEMSETVKTLALKFLRSKNATFTNLILDEPAEVWQTRLHSDALPIVFVFNREGKWTQFRADGVNYAEIEKLVVKLLAQK
jgi:thiol-disulfide isomerase/thioredoxin